MRADTAILLACRGKNVTIISSGNFTKDAANDIAAGGYIVADHPPMSLMAEVDFCSVMETWQFVNGTMAPRCPPVRGPAVLRMDLFVAEWMQTVSLSLYLLLQNVSQEC